MRYGACSMLRHILADRRILLLGLVLALVLIVTRWALPATEGYRWVVNAGYWFMLALVVVFGRALWRLNKEHRLTAGFGRFEIAVLALNCGIVGMWHAHEKPGYKILADELMLSGTAMGLHYERVAACPTRFTDVNGVFQILSRAIDKRPLCYPFIVATVHDLTGYRPENAFYVNLALAVVLLGLVYLLGCQVTGHRWAGVCGVLLFAGLPLLAQQSTGGGFELLNLVGIAMFALLLVGYLRTPNISRLEALVFGTLILASTRYESAFFLIPAAIAAWVGWSRAGRLLLSWPLLLSPLLLAPLLLQNRLFSDNGQAWEMSGRTGATTPFGLHYLPDNLGHALAFFFDFSGNLANSPIIAALGLLAFPFLIIYLFRVLRATRTATSSDIAWVLISFSLLAITGVYLMYFWGQFDDRVISRLSLPVHLLLLLAILLAVRSLPKWPWLWKVASTIALSGLLFHGLPVIARQAYRTNYVPGMEMLARTDFLKALPDRNVLFIDRDSFFWILHKIPATPIQQAQLRAEALAYHLRNHSFQHMFVYQHVLVDEKTGRPAVLKEDELGPGFELEVVFERRILTLQFARISRIVSINFDGQTAQRPVRFVEPLTLTRTSSELEKSRALYLENWIKNLP